MNDDKLIKWLMDRPLWQLLLAYAFGMFLFFGGIAAFIIFCIDRIKS